MSFLLDIILKFNEPWGLTSDCEIIIEITFEQMTYYGSAFTLETGLLIQERKRPRKLSHRVLECTIEEVSVTPAKKRVCTTVKSELVLDNIGKC